MANEKCEARCPDRRGGPDFVCQKEPHSPYVKHRDNRSGLMTWTDLGAERLRRELSNKKSNSAGRE
jgi:hypothetical protein